MTRPFELSKQMANAIRVLAMDAIQKANSGHPGLPLGMADVATILFADFLKFNPQDPLWHDRDRFVLSAGHGCMLLYALTYLTGYQGMTLAHLQNFRQLSSLTPGHPEYDPEIGIETSTGPLGQGLGNAVGMALAEAVLNARYGSDLVDHHTYALCGDGCLMEGISQEVISFAGAQKLGKLIVLFDDNSITIDGSAALATQDDTLKRFEASQWHVQRIDGHNHQEIFKALSAARDNTHQPSLIACKTIIGYGAPHKCGTASVHGSPLGEAEIKAAREMLEWPEQQPFVIPETILEHWRQVPQRSEKLYQRSKLCYNAAAPNFKEALEGRLPSDWQEPLFQTIKKITHEAPVQATRKLSGTCIQALTREYDFLMGGSADLTESNNTLPARPSIVSPKHYDGNYIHYGIREHGMAAIMNGIALHKGLIPYGGTFLVFSDYCRPSIRLSALMQQRVIYVMTHDSIGLGEDGPTHQPIEHLASLRAIPNLSVFRPADGVEVAECWMLALAQSTTPSIFALSRQSVPTLRHEYLYGENLSAYGAYIIRDAKDNSDPEITLIATGSEVALAIEVQKMLETTDKPYAVRVVSMPCQELFNQQPLAYREKTLSTTAQKFVIEAASPFGWATYATSPEHIFGIDTFGASAPAADLYQHFGLTPAILYQKITQLMDR